MKIDISAGDVLVESVRVGWLHKIYGVMAIVVKTPLCAYPSWTASLIGSAPECQVALDLYSDSVHVGAALKPTRILLTPESTTERMTCNGAQAVRLQRASALPVLPMCSDANSLAVGLLPGYICNAALDVIASWDRAAIEKTDYLK